MACCGGENPGPDKGKLKIVAGAALCVVLLAVLSYPHLRWSSFTGQVEEVVAKFEAAPSEDDLTGLTRRVEDLGKAEGHTDLEVKLTIESRTGVNLSTQQFLIVDLRSDGRDFATERKLESTFDEDATERLKEHGVRFTSKRPKGHHH